MGDPPLRLRLLNKLQWPGLEPTISLNLLSNNCEFFFLNGCGTYSFFCEWFSSWVMKTFFQKNIEQFSMVLLFKYFIEKIYSAKVGKHVIIGYQPAYLHWQLQASWSQCFIADFLLTFVVGSTIYLKFDWLTKANCIWWSFHLSKVVIISYLCAVKSDPPWRLWIFNKEMNFISTKKRDIVMVSVLH